MGLETRCGRGLITSKLNTIINWVVSLDSVYGGKCSFDAHLAHCGVEHGIPQRVSPQGEGHVFGSIWKSIIRGTRREIELHHREAALRGR